MRQHHCAVLARSWYGKPAWRRRAAARAQGRLDSRSRTTRPQTRTATNRLWRPAVFTSISGLVVEYIVAINVTRVRFPADALLFALHCSGVDKKRRRRGCRSWWPREVALWWRPLEVALCWKGGRRSRRQGGSPPLLASKSAHYECNGNVNGAAPGIEPGTSRARSEHHTTRPNGHLILDSSRAYHREGF